MRLFFSGGTGFFGRAVLRHLAAIDAAGGEAPFAEVVVLSRDPERFLARHAEFAGLPWLSFARGDIGEAATLPRAERFTHVLHAAADSTDAARPTPLQRADQIVAGTRNLLQFAHESGATRFLLTSSGGAYGPAPASVEAFSERDNLMPDPLNTANVYGVAKRYAEHLCALYREQTGLETVVARCFAFVGEDLPIDAHFAIGNFIRDALYGEAIVVGGDGTPVRSYMDQDELARWLLVLLQRGRAGEAYNVGSNEAVTIAQLAHLVSSVLAPDKPVRIQARAESAVHAQRNRYLPDIAKAEAELGLVNEIPLAQAIRRAADGIARRRAAPVETAEAAR